jgi:hypothetical protein
MLMLIIGTDISERSKEFYYAYQVPVSLIIVNYKKIYPLKHIIFNLLNVNVQSNKINNFNFILEKCKYQQ